jgi:hypothetical protein
MEKGGLVWYALPMHCQCLVNSWPAWSMLGPWPALSMLGMESHTRDLGMNYLSFLLHPKE